MEREQRWERMISKSTNSIILIVSHIKERLEKGNINGITSI